MKSAATEFFSNYGIKGVPHNWIQSYLQHNYQKVDLKADGREHHSELRSWEWGVPQRSIQGPLPFIVFISDVFKYFNAGVSVLFADDMATLLSADCSWVLQVDAKLCIEQAFDLFLLVTTLY